MKSLFTAWKEIQKRLETRNLFLFLDFDGTLTPIVEHPDKAVLSLFVKTKLTLLSKKNDLKIAIISGRQLSDIQTKVGIETFIYSGNHGLECWIPGEPIIHFQPNDVQKTIQELYPQLNCITQRFKEVFIENKSLSLSIHYRNLDENKIADFQKVLKPLLEKEESAEKIKIRFGKKVIEILPPFLWNKGNIVQWLCNKYKDYYPIYIGDDVTDEDAFKVLEEQGLTIHVGNSHSTRAQFSVKNESEVEEFLQEILTLKGKEDTNEKL